MSPTDSIATAATSNSVLDTAQLFTLCARNRDRSDLWWELLRRIKPKLNCFIKRTLLQSSRGAPSNPGAEHADGLHESDMLQSTVVKLVENDCAAMKRFSGTSDDELWAYLAVISRSVVRDALRRRKALKRPPSIGLISTSEDGWEQKLVADSVGQFQAMERQILGREIRQLSRRALSDLSGPDSSRDRLIFQLYFFEDLTPTQIAACRGISLSKTGVEKVIYRLRKRIRTAISREGKEVTIQ